MVYTVCYQQTNMIIPAVSSITKLKTLCYCIKSKKIIEAEPSF